MIYYVSDMHFGRNHPLLLRGFETIEEMTSALIRNWNNKISPTDTVYIIGDIADNHHDDIEQYISILNGKKHLIVGNQDRTWFAAMSDEKKRKLFETISFYEEINDDGRLVVLCHYPLMDWLHSKKGTYMVHGHTHAAKTMPYWNMIRATQNLLNAGVDINHLSPCTLDELITNNKLFKESDNA